MLSRASKYEVVAQLLTGDAGTLVDVGARDARLKAFLPEGIRYIAADMTSGHELLWNLEKPIPAERDAYDIVVALDVLEHVEHVHAAYVELLRVARKRLIISLPNMTCLSLRWQFFRTGRLGGKYDLLCEHQGDRHRWITHYPEMTAFVHHLAEKQGCHVESVDLLTGFSRLHTVLSWLPLPPRLRAYTVIYDITKTRNAR